MNVVNNQDYTILTVNLTLVEAELMSWIYGTFGSTFFSNYIQRLLDQRIVQKREMDKEEFFTDYEKLSITKKNEVRKLLKNK